jgi:chitodextrinase
LNPTYSGATTPWKPTGLTQTPRSTEQIDLEWNGNTDGVGVTGYKVLRNGTQIATVTTPSYSDTGLCPLTTYTYAVNALMRRVMTRINPQS